MSARRAAPRRGAPDPFPEPGLAELGLAPGDRVRFRRAAGERWKEATVTRREKDGSVGLADRRGAARSIAIAAIEVRTTGPRGGVVWEPLAERAARTEQLPLVRAATPPPTRSPRRRPSSAPTAPAADGRDGAEPDGAEPSRTDRKADRDADRDGGADPGGAEQLPLL